METAQTFYEQLKAKTLLSVLLFFIALFILIYSPALLHLSEFWWNSEEYGHGILLVSIAIYTIWQRRAAIEACQPGVHSAGLALLVVSLLLYVAGVVADIYVAQYYAFVLSITAISFFIGGARLLRPMLFPISLIFFSIPLPYLLNKLLTQKLQLLSSDIGVYFIRLMGMSVQQDGNIIDMGSFVMLVEEACSGLRYLLPLMGIGWIAAYSYRGSYLHRFLIFVVTIPITVIMNSIRIAVTGLIIKYFGDGAADGFLHAFEGWVVFCFACFLLYLFLELSNLVAKRHFGVYRYFSLRHVATPSGQSTSSLPLKSYAAVALFVVACGFLTQVFARTSMLIPERRSFDDFPLRVGQWEYFPNVIDSKILEVLRADDYFLGDFIASDTEPVNLYMAYYEKQQEGSVIHSPKDCLPAGGWKIISSSVISLDRLGLSGKANRTLIENSGDRLLVYYWVNQQGENYASELFARMTLLWRSIADNRTDGTLIRVITKIKEDEQAADKRLQAFIQQIENELQSYLPK